MEKSKEKVFVTRTIPSKASERAQTCSPTARQQPLITALKPQELIQIKAHNHVVRGKLMDNPSTVEEMCSILSGFEDKKAQFGPKPFQINSFNHMQRRQSQNLLVWLKHKISALSHTTQLSMQDFINYRQSIVNIALSTVLKMVGTVCKELSEAIGFLWNETFSMLQKMMDRSVKKQMEKDKLILNQQICLEKQQGVFVEKISGIHNSQSENLKVLKKSFKDCIITNRELNKEIERLNEELKGESIKLYGVEEALIRSIDVNMSVAQGEDLNWAKAVLNSLFKTQGEKERYKRQNKMMRYQEYSKYKVEETIARFLKSTRKYEFYTVEEITSKFLRIPSVELSDIELPGLYLNAPKDNEDSKLSYDFNAGYSSRKPIKVIFLACQSVSVSTQTQIKSYGQMEMQTFQMTNLVSKNVQTESSPRYHFSVQTEGGQENQEEETGSTQGISFKRQKQKEAVPKLKLLSQGRKSSFLPKNLFRNDLTTDTPKYNQTQLPSQENIHPHIISPRNNVSFTNQSLAMVGGVGKGGELEEISENFLVPSQVKQPKQSINSSTGKLKQTITNIARASSVIRQFRKSSMNHFGKSKENSVMEMSRGGDENEKERDKEKEKEKDKERVSGLKLPSAKKPERKTSSNRQDQSSFDITDIQAIIEGGQLSSESHLQIPNQNYQSDIFSNQLLPLKEPTNPKKPKPPLSFSFHPLPHSNPIPNLMPTHEIHTNEKIFEAAFKATRNQTFPIKNVAHKVLYLTRLFATTFSEIVKTKILSCKIPNEILPTKITSQNLKQSFQPLQPLFHTIIDKLSLESKKKPDIEKALKTLLGQLLALSQTKQMEIFVSLMGLNGDNVGATQLEILVRMMSFFHPTKPYGFAGDIKINFACLKVSLPVIIDNILEKGIVDSIINKFAGEDANPILIGQVFREVCQAIRTLKEETYGRYKYISRIFDYTTLEDLTLLFGIDKQYRESFRLVQKRFPRLADCLNKAQKKCLSEEKVWRLGVECHLPTKQQLEASIRDTQVPFGIREKGIGRCYNESLGDGKKKSSLGKVYSSMERSEGAKEGRLAEMLLFNGFLEEVVEELIGKDLAVLGGMGGYV